MTKDNESLRRNVEDRRQGIHDGARPDATEYQHSCGVLEVQSEMAGWVPTPTAVLGQGLPQ